MLHPELPLFSFLSVFLLHFQIVCHWKSQNVAILALVFWLLLVNIIDGVNAIVWTGNVRNPIPIWCDISSYSLATISAFIANKWTLTASKVRIGASYAVPLSTLCICKYLAMLSSSRKILYDPKETKRRTIFDGITCIGVPLVFMILREHYSFATAPFFQRVLIASSRLHCTRPSLRHSRGHWMSSSNLYLCPGNRHYMATSLTILCDHPHIRFSRPS